MENGDAGIILNGDNTEIKPNNEKSTDQSAALKRNKFSVSKVAPQSAEQPPVNGVDEIDGNGDMPSQEEDTQWLDSKKAAFFLGPTNVPSDAPPPALNGDEVDKQKMAKEFKVTKVGFNIDDNDNNTDKVPPLSPTNSYLTQTYDTHNLKTFGQDTLETLPNMDHYRNLLSATGAMRKRPTLAELHDLESRDEPAEIEALLLHKGGENGQATGDGTAEEGKPAIQTGPKFGWIIGVLVRCLLNIFGVMIFLRLTWVVGQAGMWQAIVIILLSAVVTIITTLSMSAICTNGEVKGGGAYYMISRSLGPEFGGAIGLIFAAANAVAIAMYIVGFAETIRDILVEYDIQILGYIHDVRLIGVITVVFLLSIAMMSLEWVIRAQLVLLVILTIAIINFFIGTVVPPSQFKESRGFVGFSEYAMKTNFHSDYSEGEDFFSVFAIFFPAATGILAGANISGDLKNAQTAIPKGTLLAILISTIVYIIMAIVAGTCALREATGIIINTAITTILPGSNLTDIESLMNTTVYSTVEYVTQAALYSDSNSTSLLSETSKGSSILMECPKEGCMYGLLNDMQIVSMISLWSPITVGGIVAATLSSALASLVAAPKVFQAVAKDKIFPGKIFLFFAKGYGAGDEPRRAYLLAFFIAFACICIGQLNAIAPLISNFFLMSYALINYSCFDASVAKAPGWRPAFKYYSKWMALVGTVLCLVVMFLINWVTALITFVIVCFIYAYIHYRKPDVNWGSSTQAHQYRHALQHSLKLVTVTDHIKNFRPQILVLSGFPSDRPALIDFTSNITKNTSLMICGNVLLNDQNEKLKDPRGANTRAATWLQGRKVKAFYNQVTAKTLRQGARGLLQCSGIGKMKPNILFQGFKSNWKSASLSEVQDYVEIIHDAFSLHYGVGILRLKEGLNFAHLNTDFEDDVSPAGIPYNLSTASGLVESASTYALRRNTSDDILDRKDKVAPKEPVVEVKSPSEVRFSIGDESKAKSVEAGVRSEELQVKDKEMVKFVNRFQRKQNKGTIDVWWLFDDGGLTLLLPYILSKKSQWANCKLRVFVAGSKEIQLDRDKRHMATLLSKFRIEYSSMTVIPDINKKPKTDQRREFDELINEVRTQHNITEGELIEQREKTVRHLRCRELLQQHSGDASLIVMTLPMPKKALYSPGLYMAWLDTLTRDMPPMLLIRGNQDSVLTFYS